MPSSKATASEEARRRLRYVESLSDARTPLADCFSILLKLQAKPLFRYPARCTVIGAYQIHPATGL